MRGVNFWSWASASGWRRAAMAALPLVIFLAGCASNRDDERRFRAAPEPPAIFTSPAVMLFSNVPPFGAKCRIERAAVSGKGRVLEGALLHRGTQLLFAGAAAEKRDRGREMTWIWDLSRGSGNALNDALPGYAPFGGGPAAAETTTGRAASGPEKIDGHSCIPEQVTFRTADGGEARYTVWRAIDLTGVPMRIKAEGGGPQFFLELSDIRAEQPAADLFEIPGDFKHYDSVKAIFDEMFRRESFGRPKDQRPMPDSDNTFEGQRQGPFRSY